MVARVQVVVEAKDAASGVLRGITAQMGGLGQIMEGITSASAGWGDIAASAADMVVNGIKDAIAVTQEYASEVRDLSLASGATAEEASRLLQVLDDYEISAQDVTAATRFLTKNGFAPTIETIAALSDEYVKLNSAEERNAFILQNLGRGGMAWQNALAQGGDALRALNEGVSENLILTDDQIRKTEEFRLAQDELNDNIEGMKVQLGLASIGIVNTSFQMQRMTELAQDMGETSYREAQRFAASIVSMANSTNSATESYTAWAESIARSQPVIEETADATDTFKTDLDRLKDILGGDLGKAQDDYNAKMAEYTALLAEARTQKEKDEINANIAAETAAYNERAMAIAFNIQQEAILNSQIPNADKLSMITALGQSYGIYDEATAAAIETTNGWITRVEEGSLSVEAATQYMRTFGLSVRESTQTISPFNEQINHLKKRSGEGAIALADFKEEQANLANGINAMAGPALHSLVSDFSQLPPNNTEYSYHFNITKSGSVPTLPKGGNGSEGHAGVDTEGDVHGYQTGGQVYANNPVIVGEAGAEPFIPSVNGRILSHAESLHALSVAGGGGGGKIGPFYGPVTISASDSDMSSIMTMR